jgi:hypothetical protein
MCAGSSQALSVCAKKATDTVLRPDAAIYYALALALLNGSDTYPMAMLWQCGPVLIAKVSSVVRFSSRSLVWPGSAGVPCGSRAAASVAGEGDGAGGRARYRWKALDMLSLLAEYKKLWVKG